MINRKGWFGGTRRNLTWWRASKCQSSSTGCEIEVFSGDVPSTTIPEGVKIFDYHYSGPLPSSATNPCISREIRDKLEVQKLCLGDRYFVLLRFDNSKLNIGDIATGKVKATIDNLYPAIGGLQGQPEDWKISILQVEKPNIQSAGKGVDISIWKLV